MHQAVIERLGVKVIVCMGEKAGKWVRQKLGANELVDVFIEDNKRYPSPWRSKAHENANGQRVLTLTHPSIADWSARPPDPTALVKRALAACP
jgi:uracil-DNA glycosylase